MDFMAALRCCTQKNWNSPSIKKNPSQYFMFTFKHLMSYTLRVEIRLANMAIWLRNLPVLDWTQIIYPSATCQIMEWILSKDRKKILNIYLMLKSLSLLNEWIDAYVCMCAWTNEHSWGREWAHTEIQVI